MENRKFETRSIVEAGFISTLIVALMLMNSVMPVFSTVIAFILPIPITVLMIRHDYKIVLGAVAVSGVLISLFQNPLVGLSASILDGLMGMTLGACIKRRLKFSTTMAYLTVATTLVMTLNIYGFMYLIFKNGIIDMLDQLVKALQQSKTIAMNIYNTMGTVNPNVEQMFKAYDMLTTETILLFLPGLIVTSALFMSYINYIITRSILKRLKFEMEEVTPFSLIYIDNRIMALVIIIICIGIILGSRNMLIGKYISNSAFIVINYIFTITGAAVVAFFLRNRFNMKRGAIIAIILFTMLGPMMRFLVYIGLADMVFDFRKIDPNRLIRRRENK